MKHLFLSTFLSVTITGVLAQNNYRQLQPTTASTKNDPFDLNKYVWSRTDSAHSKTDKPILDFKAIENDVSLGEDLAISPDGKYFAYSIKNTMTGRRDTLLVQATLSSWRQSVTTASPGFFSSDSKQYIFQDKDNLCFLQAGSGQLRTVKEVVSYQRPVGDKGQWLAYQLQNKEATLILQDLLTGTEKRFEGVTDYGFDTRYGMERKPAWLACRLVNEEMLIYNLATGKERRFHSVEGYSFNASGQALVLKTTEKINNTTQTALQYINLLEGTVHTIWQMTDSNTLLSSYSIDGSGKQVVFMVQDVSTQSDILGQPNHSIWYYQAGMDKAVLKVNNRTEGIEPGLLIQDIPAFTDNDRYIVFALQPQETDLRKPNPVAVKLDVWSHKDTILQSTQPYLLKMPARTYKAIIPATGTQVFRLERENEDWRGLLGDFGLVGKSGKEIHGDRFWEKDYYRDSIWLVSLKDGTRRFIGHLLREQYVRLSPGRKYLVYFDEEKQGNYFSINLSTGKLINISAQVPTWQLGWEDPYLRPVEKPQYSAGVAGWLEGDNGLLVYDKYYDIWQLDLAAQKPPVNITNGYARSKHIKLTTTAFDRALGIPPVLPAKASLLLKAVNLDNRQEGFYRKPLGVAGNPELLYIGPCKLDMTYSSSGSDHMSLKAADADVWIVKRQTATEAPNYQLTTDFKQYTPLTNLQPQKAYNWLTAELHSFKQLDGTTSQGILYKPENFDPNKKYPVIIVFYGTLSDQVYVYPTPRYINSPSAPKESPGWMVSHGYLVFTPDIYFTKGKWGPSALNTVDGAARYLSQLPFVDGKRMGACGHSNSGRFAYYVLTHSQSFAAMSVGAGATDIISIGLSLASISKKEISQLEWAEIGAYGTGLGNLWQNKNLWLDQTSVLAADKVTSPLLLFHNKNDAAPVGQAVEMFISLRRLEKKAWWLQYDTGGHVVGGINGKDFTIRYTQYFDHYLKGAPAPKWMTQGIPTKYKQIENGYELDSEGICGKNCPTCQARKTTRPTH